MIRLNQVKMPVSYTIGELKKKVSGILKLGNNAEFELVILKKAIDARKKDNIFYVLNVEINIKNEQAVFSGLSQRHSDICRKYSIALKEKERYTFPIEKAAGEFKHPVIIGAGPAGLFCAYELSKAGFSPVVVERGDTAKNRSEKVEEFWKNGKLDPECNVQFGEGGAGTFSDGKLNTGVNDKAHRNLEVLETFVSCGAPEDILYESKPHIGTDILVDVVTNLRNKCIEQGAEFLFNTKVTGINSDESSKLTSICLSDGRVLETDAAVLAIGHSARDTFAMLYEKGVSMQPKSFAVGIRAEHPQELIDDSQYGKGHDCSLPPSPYKLTTRLSNGRSAYSFCMCPGGHVVNASSEPGMTAVNGMSLRARNSGKANAAIVIGISPDDYLYCADKHIPEALSGIEFQRRLEKRAYIAGKGLIPVSDLISFRENKKPELLNAQPCTKGCCTPANVRSVFPGFLSESIDEAMTAFGKKIKGYDDPDTLVYAVESRTSSPVHIDRDEELQSNIRGLFPCGEGAGYAGGITSAAMDGIKAAEAAAKYLLSML